VMTFPSAITKFHAPSNQSGIHGMLHEHIQAVRLWCDGAAQYDCFFVEGGHDLLGLQGLLAAKVLVFSLFKHCGSIDPCVFTSISAIGDEPCPNVSMWMVKPNVDHCDKINGHHSCRYHVVQCASNWYLQ
ncbi:hypothetical protein DFH08DRAFT_711219, partial [Mycena albidolilacea]